MRNWKGFVSEGLIYYTTNSSYERKKYTLLWNSNTWGFVPIIFDYETNYMARYSFDKRWTGILQKTKNNYRIIEEGLNGRTTNIDYPDVKGRSGTSYLNPCLYSHAPLDLVIIQLGVNDLKLSLTEPLKTSRRDGKKLLK